MRILYKDMERFMDKVNRTENCWNWNGALNAFGYGHFYFKSGNLKVQQAHRFAYLLHVGDIPEGINVLHTCDNRRCVNPDHLFLGTQSDNMKDMYKKGRRMMLGEDNCNAKLTEQKVLKIRAMNHVTARELAKMFSVSEGTITAIRTGKVWAHI